MKKEIIKSFCLLGLMSYSGYKMVSSINSLNNFIVMNVSKSSIVLDSVKEIDYYFIIKYNELLIARFEWTIIFVFCVIMYIISIDDISLFEVLKKYLGKEK